MNHTPNEDSISAEQFRKSIQGATTKHTKNRWEEQALSGYTLRESSARTRTGGRQTVKKGSRNGAHQSGRHVKSSRRIKG
jgi:hypothetical protein